MLKVVEIFESVQGEVPAGKYALFIRLYGCNLQCPFCDTKYSWNTTTYFNLDVDLLCIPESINYIVFTGGEPLLQKTELEAFVKELKIRRPDIKIALETNGCILDFDHNLFDLIVVSPKDFYTLSEWVQKLDDNVVIKVVDKPASEHLYESIKEYIDNGLLDPRRLHNVYIMPYGISITEVNRNVKRIMQRITKHNLKGISVAYRLHIALTIK